jgi:hypothetical protein
MLTEQEIQEALHASRVVPLSVPNPHGPLGLDHLAVAVAQVAGSPLASSEKGRIRRPLELSVGAWEKLDQLAATTAKTAARPVSASEVAAAILEQVLAAPSHP